MFGLTALGGSPASATPGDAPKAGLHPLRVEDPVLWLLGRRGLLPVRAAGKGR
jgi:hypothetical protein